MTETLHTPKGREFLLMEGGPLYRLQARLGLIREGAPRVVRRTLLSIFITWVVLLILTAIRHDAFGHHIDVPFLRDFSAYTRFLIAVPLLILAEVVVGPRFARAAAYFITSGLVPPHDYNAFDDAVDRTLRTRDSAIPEFILVVISYAFALIGGQQFVVRHSSWIFTSSGAHTPAGWWAFFFCGPLLNFLMLRWLWRLILWGRFLHWMSKLDLQIFPPHPDQAGGLGFVGRTQQFFSMVLFAYSAGIAGVIANQAIYDKLPLESFVPAIVTYVVLVELIVLFPILVFFHNLHDLRIKGLYQYGALASAYTSAFHRKWILGDNPNSELLLGTADIQSLADLGNSFELVRKMDHLPMNPRTPIQIALACLIPMAPLLLIVMPLKEVLKLLFKAVM